MALAPEDLNEISITNVSPPRPFLLPPPLRSASLDTGRAPNPAQRIRLLIPSILLLRSSNPGGLIFYCVIGIGAGVYLFVQGFRLLQRRHLILDTPVSKIRSAPLGLVELNGLAVGPYTMVAPITARPCYYHRTLAWEWKQSGKNKQWVKVAAESMHVPFFLDDNTAKVMVDPRGADLDLHRDFQEEFCDSLFTTKEEAPDNVRNFLLRHGVRTTNKIKVEEFCIKPKNALFVLGTLDENPGLELTPEPIQDEEASLTAVGLSFPLGGGALSLEGSTIFSGVLTGGLQHDPKFDPIYDKALSAASARVIRLSPHADASNTTDMTQQLKVAAALMKAGISNPAAWAAAGVTPSAVTINSDPNGSSNGSTPNGTTPAPPQSAASSADFDPHPPVVLMKGKNNPTFLISWRSQRDLARSLGWKCTLMIWGGPTLALLSLYGLLTLTHLI
jgi:E3 Ubiquitin ligase